MPEETDRKQEYGEDPENAARRAAVKEAMKRAWDGYEKHAWGTDELRPVSADGHNWLGMGATIVDGLDTLWLMGMKDEFYRGRDWVRDKLDLRVDMDVSFFETTIRVLGGLLGAYALSGDRVFLERGEEIGRVLLGACSEGPLGIPRGLINLKTGATGPHKWTGGKAILADIGTVQLEFLYLSILTGNKTYARQTLAIYDTLFANNPATAGVYNVLVDPNTGVCNGKMTTVGALGDSFYEYLLKVWVFAGGPATPAAAELRARYDSAVEVIDAKLIRRTKRSNLTYIAEMKKSGRLNNVMDHLCCFAGGMLAQGSAVATTTTQNGKNDAQQQQQLRLGAELTRTCHEMYAQSPTGLAPESVAFETSPEKEMKFRAKYDLIRPETIESFFYMWRLTHDKKYRDWGWEVFLAFEKHCRTEIGYSGIKDVTKVPPEKDDVQPSWFLAETLKYLYLLFSPDDVIPLDKYVLSTEAHPFPIQKQDLSGFFVHDKEPRV